MAQVAVHEIPPSDQVVSDWISQVQLMRDAIARINLRDLNSPAEFYGQHIKISVRDLSLQSSNRDKSPAVTDRNANVDISVENVYPVVNGDGPQSVDTLQVITDICNAIAERSPDVDPNVLKEQVVDYLQSDLSDAELQAVIVDTLGFDYLDAVTDIIRNRSTAVLKAPVSRRSAVNGLHSKEQRLQALRDSDKKHKNKELGPSTQESSLNYPHVYRAHEAGRVIAANGRRYALPSNSSRQEHDKFEEYTIPAAKSGSSESGHSLVQVSEMDNLSTKTFSGYRTLNRMQSLLFDVAYHSSENMLICAPTGAGKTDAAMLTILHTVKQYLAPVHSNNSQHPRLNLDLSAFKIVYVAPMKALAAEITNKFQKRLDWLGISVREFTGDMHLTKSEINATQIIVTTPEKWDVVTRKSTGDTELVRKVRLLIIDEVHMLHDERGAVLESLVARTQRQVESTQSLIRIIGLSATLPNFEDVADFLKVNRATGMFYFDASFRPVPLEQHFVGVKGKPGSKQSKDNLDEVAYEKVSEMLKKDHQTMVFVHSRKDTYNSAMSLHELAVRHQTDDLFDPSYHPAYEQAVRDMKSSKAKELRQLLPKGLAIHHAGMARSDRNLVERLFEQGVIKVLCCTATLAWGVNLPAAAVLIKGTQLYSADEGKLVDLGILDVLQIFGRAGRPQYQDTGIGYICTTQDKLQHYLTAVTQQQPIESRFSRKMVDNLNAEISLGTVTSIADAVQWLSYSYLFVRMKRNPFAYGIDWAEISSDPHLVQRRRKLIVDAARTLSGSQMIIFNETTEELRSKDVGRIASQFYILQTSIQIFNSLLKPDATEADIMELISLSGEFDHIQSRDSEAKELQHLKTEFVPCDINSKTDSSQVKTNILLQSYISRARIEDFALVSDTAYVAQNASRICRSLFMMALHRGWGQLALILNTLCKSIEKRIWPYEHPFHQFDLPHPVMKHLENGGSTSTIPNMRDMQAAELGDLVHNKKVGGTLKRMLENFPTLSAEAEVAPLNRDILRVRLFLYPEFSWNDRYHGKSESYWVWIENSETAEIYHYEMFLLSRRSLNEDHEINFTIPLSEPLPTQLYVRVVSDRWLGAESVTAISFQHLIRPDTENVYTELLNLAPLPVSALRNVALEQVYQKRFSFFNPMQTQLFHCLYNTSENVLVGSPTGSGKTVIAELAMWWAFREKPGSKVVYIAPMKALVKERLLEWRQRLALPLNLKIVELTGDNTPDVTTIRQADVVITTPEKWDGISRSWQTRDYVRQISLVIIDEIHLLGGDRGPILEIIVSRMNYIAAQQEGKVRIVGMSTACANALDLANWLDVKEGLFNFRHSVRPVPLETFIDGFPDQRGFCPFMQSMNRPTFLAIKNHSPEKPVIVFVASRRQTRLTATDLINFCGMEDHPRRFLRMSEDDLLLNLSRVSDDSLKEALGFGIGLHHAGLVESDRQLVEELFTNQKIQILVATSTLAWGINMPAHLVVVKGTQFFDAKLGGYRDMDLTDVLQMLGRAGRPQYDSSGVARIFTQDSRKGFYKHFLHTGFPVESSLHKVLDNPLGAEIAAKTIATTQDALDYLTWTFFFRRLHKNPSFYGLEIPVDEWNNTKAQEYANEYMVELVRTALDNLAESQCIEQTPNGDLYPTAFGKIMSYFYLNHRTIRSFLQDVNTEITFGDAVACICKAAEYDDLPVRHNEDLVNAELSKNLPISAEAFDLPLWDPHIKAFLLLQAHMSRIELPIPDYVGDQMSVLDQSIRITQACVDVCAELGYFGNCTTFINLLQTIKSARWPEDSSMSTIPGFPTRPSRKGKNKDLDLKKFAELDASARRKAFHDYDITGSAITEAERAAKFLPFLSFNVAEIASHYLQFVIERRNDFHVGDQSTYAPLFPKRQIEGFFALIKDCATGELLALKRLSWGTAGAKSNKRPRINTKMQLPPQTSDRKVDLLVISDSYLHMRWSKEGIEIPAAPTVEESNDKTKKH